MLRNFFPALNKHKKLIFCDNAGGSQIPIQVLKKTNNFLINNYVQPNSNNILSKKMTKELNNVNSIANIILNNKNGNLIYGSSTTGLIYNLSNAMQKLLLAPKKNIILSDFTHESCITPFERHANNNKIKINWWQLDNDYSINYNTLLEKVDNNTSLVVIPHVSNILGNIIDIKYLNSEIKKKNKNTKVLVHGVAYLPHGIIDVYDYNIDFYTVSFYKFCGLRISVCYIKNLDFLENIDNQNHYMFDNSKKLESIKKLEVGGYNYECASSLLGLKNYFKDYSIILNNNNNNTNNTNKNNNNTNNNKFNRKLVKNVMNSIYNYEKTLIKYFKKNLNHKEIKIIECKYTDKVPIFSLLYNNYNLNNISLILNELGLITKNGNFYCDRFIKSNDGVLRISLMHYNTLEELEKILKYLNMFQKYNLNFYYNICSTIKNKVTNNIKESFNKINTDLYYKNERYRAFSLIDTTDINNLKIVGNLNFYQSDSYNIFNGDKLRLYDNINSNLLSDTFFKLMISKFKNQIDKEIGDNINLIQIHQIRVVINNNNISNNINVTPEGIHKDGYNIIGICCINRNNIEGGINNVYNENKEKIYECKLEEGEIIFLNDNNLFHDVTEVKVIDKNKLAYRDIFVLTTIN